MAITRSSMSMQVSKSPKRRKKHSPIAKKKTGGKISGSKLTRSGETFSGFNKPKRTPSHAKKSHAVLAKEGDKVKLIRFGQQGVKGAGSAPKTDKQKNRQKSFKARHSSNISKGKMSAAYWADKVKW